MLAKSVLVRPPKVCAQGRVPPLATPLAKLSDWRHMGGGANVIVI